MENKKFDPHRHPGPLEDLEKQSAQGKNSKVAIVVAALVFLLIGGLALFAKLSDGGGGDADDAIAFVPFLPIWIAVFIPLFIKKKKGTTSEDKKKVVIYIAVGIAVLLTFTAGLIIFFAEV